MGPLEAVRGASLTVAGFGSRVAVGDRVLVQAQPAIVPGEVVAFANGQVTVMPEGRAEGLAPGARVLLCDAPALYPVPAWLGRVIDGLGTAARRQGAAAPW